METKGTFMNVVINLITRRRALLTLAAVCINILLAPHLEAQVAKPIPLKKSPITNCWGVVKPVKIPVEHVTIFRGREGESYCHVQQLTSHDGKLYATWVNSPSMVVEGDDMVVLSRTSLNGPNFHDADLATVHRISNFRTMAMDLTPKV